MTAALALLLATGPAFGAAPPATVPPATVPPATIATIAGDAGGKSLNEPFGLEMAPGGKALYVCEVGHHRVSLLDLSSGKLEAVAGNGKKGFAGEDGKALEATLDEPYEVRVGASGDVYFVDMQNAAVFRVERSTGILRRVAGTGKAGFGGDGGPARDALFRQPHSIALDARGGLYVADIGNHRVRRVDLESGRIESIAGNGEAKMPEDGAVATGKPILGPRALAVSGGVLWIALREGNSLWRMDIASRRITRVAGTGKAGFEDGPGPAATFDGPKGIALGTSGEVLVADTENNAVRRVDGRTFAVTTVAGTGPKARGFGGDGGPALEARMDRPHGVAVGPDGAVFVGDSENHRVRKIVQGPR